MSQDIILAIHLAREQRLCHPKGSFDRAGRWYPDEWEECECCRYIRWPSRQYPFSYLLHCRTKRHVENLVAKHGADDETIRWQASYIAKKDLEEYKTRKQTKTRACKYGYAYKKLAIGEDGRLYSVYDGSPWVLGVERKETPRKGHNGGLYVYEDILDARFAPFPADSKYLNAPKVLVKCKVGGRYCRYGKKLAFERVTPTNVEIII